MSDSFLERQSASCRGYARLLYSFADNYPFGAEQYPDYYGGAYLDSDGALTVCVVAGFESDGLADKIKSAAQHDDVKFAAVKYSYKHLLTVREKISPWLTDGEIHSCAVLDDKNVLEVALRRPADGQVRPLNDDVIADFKRNVTDDGCVVFVQSEGEAVFYSDVGDTVSHDGGDGTAAYRAQCGGLNGVVTAGHVAALTGQVDVKVDAWFFNNAIVTRWDNFANSQIDAAFCQEKSPGAFNPTNTTAINGTVLTLNVVLPLVGTLIGKVGITTGYTQGTINSASVNVRMSGVVKTNFFSTTGLASAPGDSGACAYTMPVAGVADVVGVLSGGDAAPVAPATYFSQAAIINANFGLTRY